MSDSPSDLPQGWLGAAGRTFFVEAPPGRGRRGRLEELRRQAEAQGARAWVLPCSFDEGGPWAGIRDLFRSLIDEVSARQPELLSRHDYELVHVMPELSKSLAVRNPCLTDIAGPDEKVRNYPADRAYRIVQGLIDLLAAFKHEDDPPPWLLLCDDYEDIGHISRRFLRELMRRRGERLRLTLVVATAPGHAEEARTALEVAPAAPPLRLDVDAETPAANAAAAVVAPEEATAQAEELERRMRGDKAETQAHLAELLQLWKLAGRPDRVFHWRCSGLDIFNTLGFYEDALRYGEGLLEQHSLYAPQDLRLRWAIFVKLFMSHVGLLNIDEAYRLAREEAVDRFSDPFQKAQLYYLISMLHVRFLPERDLAQGEEYLEKGLAELQQADVSEEIRHFQTVFNRNGLALVRFFQGRREEAIELCRNGFEHLQRHLSPASHRLHRSVLLYNIAQVYSSMGRQEEAIEHLTGAMEMDPNYSEYYNERGNAHFQLGHLEEALRDYIKAAELSAPYFEIYGNIGQCQRALGRMREAMESYSTTLDLQPGQLLALLGRAQCREALGDFAGAAADYTAALEIESRQWDALANRASLLFELGDPGGALVDLNRAIELAPHIAALHQNRAVALAALGRLRDASADLESYLRLDPGAEDRLEVEERLRQIGAELAVLPAAQTSSLEVTL